MNVLGVSCHFHDAAACLVVDGFPVVAIEEERLSRRKHDSSFPIRSILYCLEEAGLSVDDLDAICFYEKPLRKMERVLKTAKRVGKKGHALARKQVESLSKEGLAFERRIKEELGFEGDILYMEHHLAHAASAYYASPFDEAAVLTVDGVGEMATTAIFSARTGGIESRLELRYPHSLGLLYSAATAFLGFAVNNDEYKVMGLAAYGQPRFAADLEKLVKLEDDGSFHLDMQYFSFDYDGDRMYSDKFVQVFGEPRVPGMPVMDRDRDFAASIQLICEKVYLGLAKKARELNPSTDNLCLAGGVALNGVANNKIAKESGFRNVFIQPAAGDGGCSMGAALWGSYHLSRERRLSQRHSTWLGKVYSQAEIVSALEAAELEFEVFEDDGIFHKVAELIAAGNIVAWHQGRSEFGPRALGSRSILADPRKADMQQILNSRIKFREEFRPFAPAVMAEKANEWFELPRESPFMLYVCPVVEAKRELVPAVTHVDGSARPQTVSEKDAPRFYRLIAEFEKLTGTPLVINTSFNVRGEPIVETPMDACNCFKNTDIDFLAVGNCLATKLF